MGAGRAASTCRRPEAREGQQQRGREDSQRARRLWGRATCCITCWAFPRAVRGERGHVSAAGIKSKIRLALGHLLEPLGGPLSARPVVHLLGALFDSRACAPRPRRATAQAAGAADRAGRRRSASVVRQLNVRRATSGAACRQEREQFVAPKPLSVRPRPQQQQRPQQK